MLYYKALEIKGMVNLADNEKTYLYNLAYYGVIRKALFNMWFALMKLFIIQDPDILYHQGQAQI